MTLASVSTDTVTSHSDTVSVISDSVASQSESLKLTDLKVKSMPTTGLPGADPGLNERRGCGWSGGPPPENFEFVDAHRHIMGQQEGGLQPLPISPPPPRRSV